MKIPTTFESMSDMELVTSIYNIIRNYSILGQHIHADVLIQYVDILKERKQYENFLFLSRTLDPKSNKKLFLKEQNIPIEE